MNGGTGVEITGEFGDVIDTRIGIGAGGEVLPGPDVGISSNGGGAEEGNRIRGNQIGDANNAAIEIANSNGNSLTANSVVANTAGAIPGRGILIYGAAGASENEIGDDTAANANVISGVGGAPIEILSDGSDGNTIGRNGGSSNGELFIDLGGAGFGNDAAGPNNGIQAPTVGKAQRGKDRVKGTGVPDATIRVYRSAGPSASSPTGLLKFLGQTFVGPNGGWKLNPAGKLKRNWRVSASQTVVGDGSSEFAPAKKVQK
jgi:hypothetical protein